VPAQQPSSKRSLTLVSFCGELIVFGKEIFAQNGKFIPVLMMFEEIFGEDILEELESDEEGLNAYVRFSQV
jgi:hypothetical protein